MMEGLQKTIRNFTKDFKLGNSSSSSSSSSSPSSSISESSGFHGGLGGVGAVSAMSSDQSRVLLTRAPRNMVSLLTCSKACAIFFVAGVIVGYTLKRRVRHWASRLLRRIKDD